MTDTLHAAAAVLTDWLLETTVHVAVLFALVLAATLLCGRRLPVRWRHALWALVLVRLLLPALPASPASLHNVAHVVARAPEVAPVRTPHRAPAGVSGPVAQLVRQDAEVATSVPAAETWPWRSTLALVWLAGAALALGRLLVTETRFARAVRREPACDDPRVRGVLDDVLRAARVRRDVRVLRSGLGGGPALTGLLRPRILVPGRMLEELSDEELRHVLAHEVAHLAAGDVLQNWLLAALEALHWFDPLVRVASARLRTERETLRDLAATRGAPREGRTAYGRTLLRLLDGGARRVRQGTAVGLFERRGDLRRRIEMIARGGGGRLAWVLGAGLTATVAAVALTGAVREPARAQDAAGGAVVDGDGRAIPGARVAAADAAAPDGPHIEVVRRSEPAPWEDRVRRALDKPLTVRFQESPVRAVLDYVGRAAELNVVVHPEAADEVDARTVTLALEGGSARQILRLALRQADLTYGVVDGVVEVGPYGGVRSALEQRFYKVAPILDECARRLVAADEEDDVAADEGDFQSYRASTADDLVMLCQTHVADPDSWSREGVSIVMWGDVMVVEHDAATHGELTTFLDMLLTRGARSAAPEPWRVALQDKLARRVSFDFEESPLQDVAAFLANTTGAPIVVDPETGAEVVLTLRLSDVSGMEAVNWVARQSRLHAAFQDGAVVLTQRPPTVVRIYDVGGFYPEGSLGTYDGLVELIVQSVAPVSWEEFGTLEFWNEMLIVRNTEDVQAQIVDFLKVARKAQEK